MDSRNVKEATPVIEDGKYLEKIYDLQKGLLESYKQIENLQEYPVDVNNKKAQVLLKDFTGRVIEELAEGFESQLMVDKIASGFGYFNHYYIPKNQNAYNDAFKATVNHIQNINEELADALHFIMELLIYTNIQPEDIEKYLEKVLKEELSNGVSPSYQAIKGRLTYASENTLGKAMTVGATLIGGLATKGGRVFLLDPKDAPHNSDGCTPIGWNAGPGFISRISQQLWDVTYSLSISRNCLKNKPWKQSGQLTDEQTYQQLIAESFVKLCGYYLSIGLTPETLFEIYFKKNCINQFRIRSKY